MRTSLAVIVIICGLACSVAMAAGPLPNGDFETALTGWELKADTGATASVSADKAHAGKGSLLLQSTAKASAAALSSPVAEAKAGDLLQIVFFARRPQGSATLLLDLVSASSELSDMGLWEARLPDDANWHKVALLVKLPPLAGGQARLGFKTLGGPGAWQIDDVSVQSGTSPAFAAVDQAGVAPVTPSLPNAWAPEGLLDARSTQIGAEQELSINVNGVEVTVRPDFRCYRGFREPVSFFGVNRGDKDKTLRAQVSGPKGVDSPAWDIPIRKNGTTTFHLGIQSLRQGQHWLKLTFTSNGQTASLPLRMTCLPSYPILGLHWQDAVSPTVLQAAAQLPLDFNVLAAAPDSSAFSPMVEAMKKAGGEYAVAPIMGQLTPQQYAAAVTALCGDFQPSFWLPYSGSDPTAAFVAAPGLVSALRKQQLPSGVLTPPMELARDFAKGSLLPVKSSLLTADRVAGMLALTCRLPRLRPSCVLSEQVDDDAKVAGGAALAQWRQSDLSAVRAILSERSMNLPLLIDRLQSAPGGDERLEALSLTKALVNCLYQGSTGVVLDGVRSAENAFGALPAATDENLSSPVVTALRLVQQELASATPLMGLVNSEQASAGADTPVTYRPFLRGGEGIVVLWNNTSAAQDVTLEFRSEPVVSRRVALSYGGEFATERWEPIMRFSEEAFKRGKPSVDLRLEPLQVQIHSFRLLDPHVAWIRGLAKTVPYVAPVELPLDRKETRTWWTDMLRARRTPGQ
ncbi:MAG: hypothetical protein ACYC63_11095 [Armatimonadota bacterium]